MTIYENSIATPINHKDIKLNTLTTKRLCKYAIANIECCESNYNEGVDFFSEEGYILLDVAKQKIEDIKYVSSLLTK